MYKKESTGWFKHYDFILLDMICLQAAFLLAYIIRGFEGNPYSIVLYRNMAVFIAFADIVTLFFFETLKNVLKRGPYIEFMETVKHVVIVSALGVFYLYLVQDAQDYSRLMLGIMYVIYFFLTYTVRQIWKTILRRRMVIGGNRSLLIVTRADEAAEAVLNLKKNNYEMFTLSGLVILDRDMTGQKIEGIPVVAGAADAPMYVCQEWIDEVLIIPSVEEDPLLQDLVHKFVESGVAVHLNLSREVNIPGQKQIMEKVGNYTVLTTSMTFVSAKQLFIKRAMDIAGGLVGCLLTGIVFIFVAPAIYISSPGPIFFSQERVGKNGKKFKMYKFRSIYLDAEERKAALMAQNKLGDAKMFKMDFDPRVIGNKILPDGTKKTGIGSFIRSTSLDEFPQFFNVLKGDMSIVGTRPPLIGEVSEYELHHRARLAIKPGITGMWQVSGRSDITDFEEVVKLDTQYISNWSVGLDIKILLKTILVVFKKEGSV